MHKCKECHKAGVRANRRAKVGYYRDYDRSRSVLKHRAENTARVVSRHREQYPERMAAHNAVARAIRARTLSTPGACWHCGSGRGVGGHHASYAPDMRLAVSWLCQACHKQVHLETERIIQANA